MYVKGNWGEVTGWRRSGEVTHGNVKRLIYGICSSEWVSEAPFTNRAYIPSYIVNFLIMVLNKVSSNFSYPLQIFKIKAVRVLIPHCEMGRN